MCYKVGGKPEDSCPGRCNAYKKVHYERISPQDGKFLDEQSRGCKAWGKPEGSQDERWNKIYHFIPLIPVQIHLSH